MPPAESLFGSVANRDMIAFGIIFLTIVILAVFRRLPEPWRVRQYVSILNDRGGNILILVLLSAWFFSTAIRMFYTAFGLMKDGKIEAQNAILLMALQFVSGTAFGGSVAVLYKTMTGSDSTSRGTDGAPVPGTRTSSQLITKTETAIPPAKPVEEVPGETHEPPKEGTV